MTLPALLDFDSIVAPISDSQPCGSNFETGENTSLSQAFSELRTLAQIARRIEAKKFELAGMSLVEQQITLEQSKGTTDGPQADPKWERIAELAIEILSKYSKDTRALVCLIEALTRLHGLPGLRDSLKAGSLLLDRYKLSLYPLPEPGEKDSYCLEFIKKICESESNSIKQALYQIKVIDDSKSLSWVSHISAMNLEKLPPKVKTERIEAGEISLENFTSAFNHLIELKKADRLEDHGDKLRDFPLQITEASNEAKNFDKLLSTYSKGMYGIRAIIEDLDKLQRWYVPLVQDCLEAIADSPAEIEVSPNGEEPSSTATANSAPNNAPPGAQAIANRQQALQRLLEVSTYFRNAEPHSPVSYALEQAVRWGKMPLPDLLRDLVSNESVLTEVYRRMGIQENNGNSDKQK